MRNLPYLKVVGLGTELMLDPTLSSTAKVIAALAAIGVDVFDDHMLETMAEGDAAIQELVRHGYARPERNGTYKIANRRVYGGAQA